MSKTKILYMVDKVTAYIPIVLFSIGAYYGKTQETIFIIYLLCGVLSAVFMMIARYTLTTGNHEQPGMIARREQYNDMAKFLEPSALDVLIVCMAILFWLPLFFVTLGQSVAKHLKGKQNECN